MSYKLGVIAMTSLNHLLRAFALLALLICLSQGCGKSDSPTAAPEPFKAAVAQYLDQNNMAMALKQIKAGPPIEGTPPRSRLRFSMRQFRGPRLAPLAMASIAAC